MAWISRLQLGEPTVPHVSETETGGRMKIKRSSMRLCVLRSGMSNRSRVERLCLLNVVTEN